MENLYRIKYKKYKKLYLLEKKLKGGDYNNYSHTNYPYTDRQTEMRNDINIRKDECIRTAREKLIVADIPNNYYINRMPPKQRAYTQNLVASSISDEKNRCLDNVNNNIRKHLKSVRKDRLLRNVLDSPHNRMGRKNIIRKLQEN